MSSIYEPIMQYYHLTEEQINRLAHLAHLTGQKNTWEVILLMAGEVHRHAHDDVALASLFIDGFEYAILYAQEDAQTPEDTQTPTASYEQAS